MAAPAFAFTINAPPKSSGEDEQLLWDLADEMHPENGCLWDPWRQGSADDCLHARRNGISERPARGAQTQSAPPRGTERMVSAQPQRCKHPELTEKSPFRPRLVLAEPVARPTPEPSLGIGDLNLEPGPVPGGDV